MTESKSVQLYHPPYPDACCPPAPSEEQAETCVWTQGENGWWKTGCGRNTQKWKLCCEEFKFCPYCGKPIEEKARTGE